MTTRPPQPHAVSSPPHAVRRLCASLFAAFMLCLSALLFSGAAHAAVENPTPQGQGTTDANNPGGGSGNTATPVALGGSCPANSEASEQEFSATFVTDANWSVKGSASTGYGAGVWIQPHIAGTDEYHSNWAQPSVVAEGVNWITPTHTDYAVDTSEAYLFARAVTLPVGTTAVETTINYLVDNAPLQKLLWDSASTPIDANPANTLDGNLSRPVLLTNNESGLGSGWTAGADNWLIFQVKNLEETHTFTTPIGLAAQVTVTATVQCPDTREPAPAPTPQTQDDAYEPDSSSYQPADGSVAPVVLTCSSVDTAQATFYTDTNWSVRGAADAHGAGAWIAPHMATEGNDLATEGEYYWRDETYHWVSLKGGDVLDGKAQWITPGEIDLSGATKPISTWDAYLFARGVYVPTGATNIKVSIEYAVDNYLNSIVWGDSNTAIDSSLYDHSGSDQFDALRTIWARDAYHQIASTTSEEKAIGGSWQAGATNWLIFQVNNLENTHVKDHPTGLLAKVTVTAEGVDCSFKPEGYTPGASGTGTSTARFDGSDGPAPVGTGEPGDWTCTGKAAGESASISFATDGDWGVKGDATATLTASNGWARALPVETGAGTPFGNWEPLPGASYITPGPANTGISTLRPYLFARQVRLPENALPSTVTASVTYRVDNEAVLLGTGTNSAVTSTTRGTAITAVPDEKSAPSTDDQYYTYDVSGGARSNFQATQEPYTIEAQRLVGWKYGVDNWLVMQLTNKEDMHGAGSGGDGAPLGFAATVTLTVKCGTPLEAPTEQGQDGTPETPANDASSDDQGGGKPFVLACPAAEIAARNPAYTVTATIPTNANWSIKGSGSNSYGAGNWIRAHEPDRNEWYRSADSGWADPQVAWAAADPAAQWQGGAWISPGRADGTAPINTEAAYLFARAIQAASPATMVSAKVTAVRYMDDNYLNRVFFGNSAAGIDGSYYALRTGLDDRWDAVNSLPSSLRDMLTLDADTIASLTWSAANPWLIFQVKNPASPSAWWPKWTLKPCSTARKKLNPPATPPAPAAPAQAPASTPAPLAATTPRPLAKRRGLPARQAVKGKPSPPPSTPTATGV